MKAKHGEQVNERSWYEKDLLLSCLSRLVVETQCSERRQSVSSAIRIMDPVVISRAIIRDILSFQEQSSIHG
jgi:hypothetical protein